MQTRKEVDVEELHEAIMINTGEELYGIYACTVNESRRYNPFLFQESVDVEKMSGIRKVDREMC